MGAPPRWTAFAIVWTTLPGGAGELVDAGMYGEETPTPHAPLNHPRRLHSFVVGHARSSRSYAAACAKLCVNLQRCGFFDRLSVLPRMRVQLTR